MHEPRQCGTEEGSNPQRLFGAVRGRESPARREKKAVQNRAYKRRHVHIHIILILDFSRAAGALLHLGGVINTHDRNQY